MVDTSVSNNPPPPPESVKSLPPRTVRPKLPQGPSPGPNRVSPLSWIFFLLLMVWNLWSLFPRETSEVTLPYSAFVAQVRAGNVPQVRIVGEQIGGTFVHAITWPEPAKTEPTNATGEKKAGKIPPASSYSA